MSYVAESGANERSADMEPIPDSLDASFAKLKDSVDNLCAMNDRLVAENVELRSRLSADKIWRLRKCLSDSAPKWEKVTDGRYILAGDMVTPGSVVYGNDAEGFTWSLELPPLPEPPK